MSEHGVRFVTWDNLGGGWRVECLCGFFTCPDKLLQYAGEEFDDHYTTEAPLVRE
jgi:hypothetical protein